jgi:DNA-binding SARP family transcriptional activator/class 3 adenylate cyclase
MGDEKRGSTPATAGMIMTGKPDQAAGLLDLRVLGEFTVLRHGKRVALPPSRKTRALLAYLAVVDGPQRREHLCRMFWNTPNDPRGALRWSLSKIRRIVNVDGRDELVADRSGVALRSQAIALDLRRIQEMARQHLPAFELSRLEEAAGLFRGGFLEDLALPRCPEFEAWRVSQVSEVGLLKATILRALIDRLVTEPSRALPHAHALQAMDPNNGGVAAEVKVLADRAREQAVRRPPAGDGAGRSAGAAPQVLAAQVLAAQVLAAQVLAPQVLAQQVLAPGEASRVDDERRHVTVLSIEIVSPLHAFASVAPEVALRQVDPLFEATHAIIELHGGIISGSGNSGITVVFGEGGNHAVAACRAALAVKSTIELQSEGNVRVRAGLDSGEVVVRHRRSGMTERTEVISAAVRTATRLVHSLRRGILAVTGRTHVAVGDLMDIAPLLQSETPRFGRDEQVYQLLGEKPGS